MQRLTTKKYFILSMTSHFLLILLSNLAVTDPQEADIGKQQSKQILVNFYQNNFLQPARFPPLKTRPHSNPVSSHAAPPLNKLKTLHAKNIDKTNQEVQDKQITFQNSNATDKPIPELVKLLHKAIQQQQQYPISALQMEKEGSVIIQFILFPNGNIQGIKMIKSSQTTALDEAAMTAIKNAQPFKGVSNYLAKPHAYQVTIAFELG